MGQAPKLVYTAALFQQETESPFRSNHLIKIGQIMKKLILAMFALASAASFAADLPATCADYFKTAEETFKKDGNDVDAAMKVIKDQIAAVPADQQEAFCKDANETLKNPPKEDKEAVDEAEDAKADAKEEAEEAKAEAAEAKAEAAEAKAEAKEEAKK